MRLEYIRSFVGVVKHKSFSAAAKSLYLSQPTISTHIKHLEMELGVPLLIRSTKDILLSEDGKIFYPYALQLLETEHSALLQLGANKLNPDKMITIAVSSVPGYYMFPQFLSYFRVQNPTITFRIIEGDSINVLSSLLDFSADIGIGGLNSNNLKIHSEKLFEDEIILITPNTAKYRNMNGAFPLSQLKQEFFITREPGSGTKQISQNIMSALKLNDTSLKVAAQFDSSEMVRRSVENGAGIAFISRIAAQESLDKQKILSFSFPDVFCNRSLYLMYHNDRSSDRNIGTVISALQFFCQEIFYSKKRC